MNAPWTTSPSTSPRALAAVQAGLVGSEVERSSSWVKHELSGFLVTPGRLLVVLGLFCLLWGSRHRRRKAIMGVGLALTVLGVILMLII